MGGSLSSTAARSTVVLVLAAFAAAAIIFSVQFGFRRLLLSPSFAAWSSYAQEAVFTLALFLLLGAAALVGLRLTKTAVAAGRNPGARAAAGLIIGVAGVGLALSLSGLAGASKAGGGALLLWVPMLLGTVVTFVQVGAEELYFRGWLQQVLQCGWGWWQGILGAAVTFAVLHFVSGEFDPISLANIVLAGLWFGLLADRSGGLALPVSAHFGWNWAEEMLFGAVPNPGVSSYGSLLDWDLVSRPSWGGSEAGLNASLSVSFVLLASVIATWSWRGSVSSPGPRG